MLALGNAFKGLGHGTLEIISDYLENDDELAWIEQIMRDTGRTVTTLASPRAVKIWERASQLEQQGLDLRPQIGAPCIYPDEPGRDDQSSGDLSQL